MASLREVEAAMSLRAYGKKSNGFFLWAPEFSNVHTTFKFMERPIIIDKERYSGKERRWQ